MWEITQWDLYIAFYILFGKNIRERLTFVLENLGFKNKINIKHI